MKEAVETETQEYDDELALTSHPPWAEKLWNDLVPLKDQVAGHAIFQSMAAGELPIEHFRQTLLNFYPLVECFPKYMGLNLAKCQTTEPGHEQTRNWLMTNMRVEQRHAQWYRDWAVGFGVSDDALAQVRPPAAMDAVNHYLWNICRAGTLIEGIAGANLAIEWATGEWTRHVVAGMRAYQKRGEAQVDRRSMAWLRAHAHYDDLHPHEAMELIKWLAQTERDQERAFHAAERGLEYYLLALDDCWIRYRAN